MFLVRTLCGTTSLPITPSGLWSGTSRSSLSNDRREMCLRFPVSTVLICSGRGMLLACHVLGLKPDWSIRAKAIRFDTTSGDICSLEHVHLSIGHVIAEMGFVAENNKHCGAWLYLDLSPTHIKPFSNIDAYWLSINILSLLDPPLACSFSCISSV